MSDQINPDTITRRSYVKLFGTLAGGMTLAGCTDDSGSNSGNNGTSGGTNALQIQHWWTSGGDGKAMDTLLKRFKEKHPDIEIKDNPVSGAGGQNLHSVIKKKVINGNPPSTWQDWPGANLTPYVEADALKDIGDTVWSSNSMKDAYRKGPKVAARAGNPDNPFVAVPLNIHRLNNLFYNVKLVEQAGVDPSSITDPKGLINAMETIESKTDAAGMANQTSSTFSTLQLWGEVLLGMYGNKAYQNFISGQTDGMRNQIRNSLDIVKQYSKYYTKDAGSINSDEAGYKVANGKAAFMHMGDWQAGNFETIDGFEYKSGWNHVPFPGTGDYYQLNMDAFSYPKSNPSPEVTRKFLKFVGSVEAQKMFNPKKGSIPPRSDVPSDNFSPFLQKQMEQFANSKAQPPSIAHGLAVSPNTLNALKSATSRFISGYNVGAATDAFISAIKE